MGMTIIITLWKLLQRAAKKSPRFKYLIRFSMVALERNAAFCSKCEGNFVDFFSSCGELVTYTYLNEYHFL